MGNEFGFALSSYHQAVVNSYTITLQISTNNYYKLPLQYSKLFLIFVLHLNSEFCYHIMYLLWYKALILLCIFGIISCSKENCNLIPSTELDDNAYDTTRKFLHVNYGWGGNNDGDKQYSRTIDRLNGEVFVYLDSNVFTYVVNNTLSAFNSCLLGFSNIHPNNWFQPHNRLCLCVTMLYIYYRLF